LEVCWEEWVAAAEAGPVAEVEDLAEAGEVVLVDSEEEVVAAAVQGEVGRLSLKLKAKSLNFLRLSCHMTLKSTQRVLFFVDTRFDGFFNFYPK
jgi:hypothetical protein